MSDSTRRLKDANLTTTKALPAAAANNDATAIDLGSVTLGAAAEAVEVLISVPALPALVDAKTVTITLQDSADNSSFTAITGLSTLVITGAGGVGASATTRRVKLPSTCRRYLRFNSAVLTAGGDNTGVSVTMQVLA